MSIDLARKVAGALGVHSNTKIRAIDEALTAYARLTAQSPVVPFTGTADASQVISGEFDDDRISESSVTQHEAALQITESQVSDLGTYIEQLGTQSTVGSAGGASALPATPTGYVQVDVGSGTVVIPYYDAS